MATFKICVFEHQKRKDNKFPVSIRIFWKGKFSFLQTEYYVSGSQVKKVSTLRNDKKKTHLDLIDKFILNELNTRIARYEDLKVKKLRHNIELYTAKDLAEYFKREGAPGTDSSIDFIEFSRRHVQKLINQGRKSTAATLSRTINAITDFAGRESVSVTEINSKFLIKFEEHLKTVRILKRKNQYGNCVTVKKQPLSDVSITDYMTDVRTLFNACRDEYNDEDKDEIRVKHYPFKKYKLKKAPEARKRNVTADQVKTIIKCEPKLDRSIIARDVFILSFMLAGMNFADLYDVRSSAYSSGRLTYKRQKVRRRRRDEALISIKVEPETLPYFERYKDKTGARVFNFYQRYSDSHIFTSNINKGLKNLALLCEIKEPLSTYYARHSFATIARNCCDASKDDINLALNHVDAGLKMTDVYIKKDWSRIDSVVRKVIDYIADPLPGHEAEP